MKTIYLVFLIVLLAVNVNTMLNQSPAYANGYIYLANGIKVDNVESADCNYFGQVQYCQITFNFGETILTVSTSESYLAFDRFGGLVEF